MTRPRVEITASRGADEIDLTWRDQRSDGRTRFQRAPGARPEWIAEADELLAGADRRNEGAVLDAVAAWASAEGLVVGVWHPDGTVEVLDD